MNEKTEKNIHEWLDGDYDAETKETIRRMQKEDPSQLEDAFTRTGVWHRRPAGNHGCRNKQDE